VAAARQARRRGLTSLADDILKPPDGVEVLRIAHEDQVCQLDHWVHDAHLEDALQFSAQSARAVIPFAQESAWAPPHPSMADPELVKTTRLARHYRVPWTRCYIVVEHAESLESEVEWGSPSLVEADFSESTFRLMADSDSAAVSVQVTALDIRLLVSSAQSARTYRKVLRWGSFEWGTNDPKRRFR
jgi:hypothetical protein